jgi:hypothetical protein
MKKVIYAVILPLIMVSGLVLANLRIKDESSRKPKPHAAAEGKAALKKWEATPDGIKYKKWVASPEGKKVFAGTAKISSDVREYRNMEATITALSLPKGSRLGFGLMVRIKDEEYILAFGPGTSDKNFFNFNNEFGQLRNLKVNDKIIIKSHSVSHAPKYAYPILSGDYVERDSKIIYKRAPVKGGC